jgi:transposase
MKEYVGLDVSLEVTHFCIVDETGTVVARGRVASEPEAIAAVLRERSAGEIVRVVHETGGMAHWLQRELEALGLPAVLVDARKAKGVLKAMLNKTDKHDAHALARLAQSGFIAPVAGKSRQTQLVRALLTARQQMMRKRRDLENQIRALLRGFGLKVGKVSKARFAARVRELLEAEPLLEDAVAPLLAVRRALVLGQDQLDARLVAVAGTSPVCRRLMSVPGVGPLTALAFMTAIDDPHRFRRSASVGAYLGLTPRRYQSGEMGYTGRISKWGDGVARHFLYEAANSLISRVKRWSAPKAWACRLVPRLGGKKARVALARKLAVILHRMWVDGTEFRMISQAATA